MDYNLYEFSSSGMSHTNKDLHLNYVIDLFVPETY